jgi:hypothetical protein
MSADPSNAPPISIRRRGLIAPTQALAPSPTASLSALVQSGKDVAGIAEALGVSPDEARARLVGFGLLALVVAPGTRSRSTRRSTRRSPTGEPRGAPRPGSPGDPRRGAPFRCASARPCPADGFPATRARSRP